MGGECARKLSPTYFGSLSQGCAAVLCSQRCGRTLLRKNAEMGDSERDGLAHGEAAAPKFFLVHAGAEDESIRGFNFESVGHAQEVDVS